LAVAVGGVLAGCSKDADSVRGDYGYVQFRLFKSGSYKDAASSRAGVGMLDYLGDAAKIQLSLRPVTGSGGSDIRQTVPLEAQNGSSAEYGMQTSKFLLLAGEYELVEYSLYTKLDEEIPNFQGVPDTKTIVTIVQGGLTLQDIVVNTRERGGVQFRLTKANVDEITHSTRAGGTALKNAFHNILAFDVTVRNDYLGVEHTYEKLDVRHRYFRSDDDPDYHTSEAVCDSIVTGLRGGEWRVVRARVYYDDISYTTLDDLTEIADNSFTVYDNATTEVAIPVTLSTTAADIQDALALKEIWDALDGPNWRVKWDFNRDVDLWAAQPGVSVLSNGRVAALDLSEVGAKGAMPAAIAKLTELRQIYLGTHNWWPSAGNLDPATAAAARRQHTLYDESRSGNLAQSFHETFIDEGEPLHKFSKEMQLAFVFNGTLGAVKEGSNLRALNTGSTQNYSNMVTSLPEEINQLKHLKTLFIAHSAMETLPDDLSGLESLTELEIFNCPNLTTFPKGIATLPSLWTLVVSVNPNIPKEETYEGLVALAAGSAAKTLQTLQISGQPVDKIPDLRSMTRLGRLDIQNCGVQQFEEPFSENQVLSFFNARDNELTDLPRNGAGHFMGIDGEIERFDCSNNKFTEFPDIFEADNEWRITNVDFSSNNITSIENGYSGDGSYRGVYAEILSLAYNDFEKFPREILHSGSSLMYLQLQGNRISIDKRQSPLDTNHPDEDWFDRTKAPKASYLTALDLSYNKLDRLPSSFNGESLPFMVGVDLSYNRFSTVPMNNVFNLARLTTFIFRGQRDADGNRIMRSWPTGAYSHRGLRAMYLGSNDIRAVNDDLNYTWAALEIADNPNITIDVSQLCYYISVGMMFVYDPWQDIRGCPSLRLDK
jgi:Leucine-rich repeat (LRR) protein